MYKTWIVIFVIISSGSLYAVDIDSFLQEIESNNKELKAAQKMAEAQKASFGQDLLLPDPTVEAGFMNGSGADAVKKKEYGVSQSFEFPTVYFKKSALADMKRKLAEAEYKVTRNNILLEAKMILMEYVVNLKKSEILNIRYKNSRQIYESFKKRLESGDIGIIDYNKSKMELLTAKTLLQTTDIELDNARESLKQLNGGKALPPLETDTYKAPMLPVRETLKEEFLKNDPDLKLSLLDIETEERNLSLKKWSALPKFDIGYNYSDEGTETFSGLSFGISIPIFESNNTIKTAEAELEFKQELRQSIVNKKLHELKAKTDKLTTIEQNLVEYDELFDNVETIQLLEKAFNLGELSAVEYFYEINYYYEIYDTYLELELSKLKLNAEILSYQL